MFDMFSKNWIIPLIIFTILVFLGARAHPLWGDEAETANLARSINEFGIPRGWDGVNLLTGKPSILGSDLVDHAHSWMQFYLVAISFRLFGESAFSARLPFIIISFFCIPLLYFFALRLTQSKKVAFLSTVILALSVPFILFAYQSRYYIISVFAGLLLSISALGLKSHTLRYKLLFVTAGIIYSYNSFMTFPQFITALFLGMLIFLKLGRISNHVIKKFILKFILLVLIILFAYSPWLWVMKPFESRGGLTFVDPFIFIMQLQDSFQRAILPFNLNDSFPFLLLVPLLAIFVNKFKQKASDLKVFAFASLVPSVYLLSSMILTPFTLKNSVDVYLADTRYHTIVFPFFAILMALIFREIWKWNKTIFIIALPIFLFTNIFTLTTPRIFLAEYIKDSLNPYPSPDKIVADYLKIHAKEGDLAFVNLERNFYPLIFYLGKKIRFINRINPADLRLLAKNKKELPTYLYLSAQTPDWVILYSKRERNIEDFFTYDYMGFYPRGLFPQVDLQKDYQEVVLPVFFSDLSRPEMVIHAFEEVKPDINDQIFIYRKINR